MVNTEEVKLGDTLRIINGEGESIQLLIGVCGTVEVIVEENTERIYFIISTGYKLLLVYPEEVELVKEVKKIELIIPYDATPLHRWLAS